MTKPNKNKKKVKKKNRRPQEAPRHSNANPSNGRSDPKTLLLPLRFPSHNPQFPTPRDDFLRNVPPYQASFQKALETSYLGLAVDANVQEFWNTSTGREQPPTSTPLTATLQSLHLHHQYFQTDVTQPFGLGTKCAKTYVTRCLVGEYGTTYKYLGLRMFAQDWNNCTCTNDDRELASLLCEIRDFKDQVLVPRTKQHLANLDQQRQRQHQSTSTSTTIPSATARSKPKYNICLINRMENDGDNPKESSTFKLEPTLQRDKTAVAWHADSTLEHFSNIAVYQVLLDQNKDDDNLGSTSADAHDQDHEWALAVRVMPNAEGPAQQPLIDDPQEITEYALPLSLTLPNGSAYYMLDDFNHHHQHTVLLRHIKDSHHRNAKRTVRYSCTYRLLRSNHTVDEILQQCDHMVKQFHKRTVARWKTEFQYATHTMESEWLRQFYIQGQHHYDRLWWSSWKIPLQQMWKYWAQFETRARHIVDLLQMAAQGRVYQDNNLNNASTTTKADRKQREKCKKAVATMEDLLQRGHTASEGALQEIFEPIAVCLEERATMRALWAKRERDHVFTTLHSQFRPLAWPVQYAGDSDTLTSNDKPSFVVEATSPMPASPQELRQLAQNVRAWGQAFMSQNAKDLPHNLVLRPHQVSSCNAAGGDGSSGQTPKSSSGSGAQNRAGHHQLREKKATTITIKSIAGSTDHCLSHKRRRGKATKKLPDDNQEGDNRNAARKKKKRRY